MTWAQGTVTASEPLCWGCRQWLDLRASQRWKGQTWTVREGKGPRLLLGFWLECLALPACVDTAP